MATTYKATKSKEFYPDKYKKEFVIEKMKQFYFRKHDRYPSMEMMYNEFGWTKSAIQNLRKKETDKEADNTVSYWWRKIKDLQQQVIIDKVVENNSPQCLLFIAKNIHKIGEENKDIESTSASELDIKKAILNRDIELFFKLARKENIDPIKKFVHLEGGRAGGKSEQVARYIILKALERDTQGTILCGREIQKSTETSVKPLLERIIEDYKLQSYFNITKKEITCILNGVRIIFMGLKEACSDSSDTLKSTDLLFLAWIEEAQSISQQSLDKLIPTASRVEGFQLIFTYNRNRQTTIVYDHFFGEGLPAEWLEWTQHVNINYKDNKFNSDELIALAELDKKTNIKKYNYIWGGLPQTEFDGALWTYEAIKELNINIPYNKDNYTRRIVATDPATSHKDFNNEYGITVLGLTHEGYVHLIADHSGHYTAYEYAKAVVQAYFTYECEAIVYEENQGGDHVANTILSESKSVRLIPVRATQSKYLRALPIANLCEQGRIYFTKSFPVLENQMLLLTIQGYQGSAGESPDRLDSFVWGCYELLGLKEANSIDVYFKKAWFKQLDTEHNHINEVGYYSLKGSKTVFILFDYITIRKGFEYIPHINIKEIKVVDTNEAYEQTKDYLTEKTNILAYDDNTIDIEADRIEFEDKLTLTEYASKTITYIQNGFIFIDPKIENIIIDNVCQYIPEEVKENNILEAILELVYHEWEAK